MSTASEYMDKAAALADKGMDKGHGGPFGCIIVKNGEIVAEAWNETFHNCDPTAHAEVQAIRKACKKLGTLELAGTDMYTTGEPCPMCMAAIYWAMIDNVYFANTKEEAALCGFDDTKIYAELSKNWNERVLNMAHLPREAATELFIKWQEKGKAE